jgi:MerR family copper efflux transcriptional regulator
VDYTYPALAGGEDLSNLSRAQLARAASIGLETIRFYEKEGLLPAPMRSPSGYRQYSDADLSRLKFIAAAKNLGFTLQETAELLSIGNHPSVCPDLRQKAQQRSQRSIQKSET